ncbi:MAG: NAD(P)H-hydrate dehydratase [Gammaproteobacteria bacterium]
MYYDDSMSQLPEALFSAAQMRELDQRAIAYGIALEELMRRAGAAAWEQLEAHWPQSRHILVMAGAGNNAGDGYVLASCALKAKRQVTLLNVGETGKLSGAAATARKQYLAAKGQEQKFANRLPDNADVIVDALFGTGLDRPLQDDWLQAVQLINASHMPVLALDIPSGLNADTGVVMGAAVAATVTTAFIGMKVGLLTGDGPDCSGEILLATLDLPSEVYASIRPFARCINNTDAHLFRRPRASNKGMFGHVLVIGSDHGMGGAVRFTAEAALRSGAGLVTVATRPTHVAGLLAGLPEAMVCGIDDPADVAPLLARATVIAIGPGLGQDDWGRILLARALDTPLPLVVDADMLNLLAAHPVARGEWVLTPHPGEAGRLLKLTTEAVQQDRFQAAAQLVERYRAVVVLKGVGTIVAAADETAAVCIHGNPGMAAPGMGDALTGVIAALIAQGLPLSDAARAGVQFHALAGDRAAESGERGLMTRDLIAELRHVVNA